MTPTERRGPVPSELDVELRRLAFGIDAETTAAMAEIWAVIGPRIDWITDAFWDRFLGTTETATLIDPANLPALVRRHRDYNEYKYTQPIDQAWIDRVAWHGSEIAYTGVQVPNLLGCFAHAQGRLTTALCEGVQDPSRLPVLIKVALDLAILESEIICARVASSAAAPRWSRPATRD